MMIKSTLSTICFALLINSAWAENHEHAYILSSKEAHKKVSEPNLKEKQKADYDKLIASVRALTDALTRESEKVGVDNKPLLARSQQDQQQAKSLADKKQYVTAHELLENTYQALRGGIVSIEQNKPQPSFPEPDRTSLPTTNNMPDHREKDFKTSVTLLDALKRQNQEKLGGKEAEIAEIEALINEAHMAEAQNDYQLAQQRIQEANILAKTQIASLQQPSINTISVTTPEHADPQVAYDKKRASLLALLDAGRRISDERGKNPAFMAQTEAMLSEADTKWQAGQQQAGQKQLNLAYTQLKSKMANLVESHKPHK